MPLGSAPSNAVSDGASMITGVSLPIAEIQLAALKRAFASRVGEQLLAFRSGDGSELGDEFSTAFANAFVQLRNVICKIKEGGCGAEFLALE